MSAKFSFDRFHFYLIFLSLSLGVNKLLNDPLNNKHFTTSFSHLWSLSVNGFYGSEIYADQIRVSGQTWE